MREELKNNLENEHELYEEDFDYTMRITKKFAETRIRAVSEDQASISFDKEVPEDAMMEVMNDLAYYAYVEMEYIWHYCLWRLQAILEGLISFTFLKDLSKPGLMGLKSKLDALKSYGYTIEDNDYLELLDWAKFRNILSHHPPGSFFPGPLCEADVDEYYKLCKRLCSYWRHESKSILK